MGPKKIIIFFDLLAQRLNIVYVCSNHPEANIISLIFFLIICLYCKHVKSALKHQCPQFGICYVKCGDPLQNFVKSCLFCKRWGQHWGLLSLKCIMYIVNIEKHLIYIFMAQRFCIVCVTSYGGILSSLFILYILGAKFISVHHI